MIKKSITFDNSDAIIDLSEKRATQKLVKGLMVEHNSTKAYVDYSLYKRRSFTSGYKKLYSKLTVYVLVDGNLVKENSFTYSS